MQRFIIIFTTLFLSACSQYPFSSNVDKQNFVTYFKPSSVLIYSKEEAKKLNVQWKGTVTGSSCQINVNDRPASQSDARTKARINAANLGANGIVFQTCLNFDADSSCLSNVICYARALSVEIDE
ncbi:Rcs stress response system protein RcsF [Psychromonas sp. CD1]|uniref:Rcs stress response system protein RcsF n=1 Tax=Psychromonas sp. CD1 TaxID=1979839 RepID=UPI0021515415|nr:Rcs stress response system protein RcsF [Psychromonas sp. CD1]